MKKVLSVILTVVLVFSAIWVPASISADSNVIVSFDTVDNITGYYVTNVSRNTDSRYIKEGTGSLKMENTIPTGQGGNVGGMIKYSFPSNMDFSSVEHFEIDMWFASALTGSNGIQFNFYNTALSIDDGYNAMVVVNDAPAGWNHLTINKPANPAIANTSWSSINGLRITWFHYAQTASSTVWYVDNLTAVGGSSPTPPPAGDGLLVGFNSKDNFTSYFNTAINLNTNQTYIKEGTGSIKADFSQPKGQGSNIGGMIKYKLPSAVDLSKADHFEMDVYLASDLTASDGLQVNFCNSAISTDDGFNSMVSFNNSKAGWHHITISKPKTAAKAGTVWTSIDAFRFTWFHYSQSLTSVTTWYFDNLISVSGTAPVSGFTPYRKGSSLKLHDFDSSAGLKGEFNIDYAIVTGKDVVRQGTGALDMGIRIPAGQASNIGGMVLIDLSAPCDLSGYEELGFEMKTNQPIQGSGQLQINLCTTGQDGYNVPIAISNFTESCHSIKINMATILQSKAVDSADIKNIKLIRITFFNLSQYNYDGLHFFFDNLSIGKKYTATLDNQGASTAGTTSETTEFDGYLGNNNFKAPVKSGNIFKGYYSEPNGGGSQYIDENGVSTKIWDVEDDKTLYAFWEKEPQPLENYITVKSNNSAYGSVSGSGQYNIGDTVTVSATPKSGYEFISWQDGNTDNPRSFKMEGSATYTATFEAVKTNYITAIVKPYGFANIEGGGYYSLGGTVKLTVTPKRGYKFRAWQDGNTDNPRTFTMTGSATYTALIEPQDVSIKVISDNEDMGTVEGAGTYKYGTTATIKAIPKAGYKFVKWEDKKEEEYTDNPLEITIGNPTTYTAYFEKAEEEYISGDVNKDKQITSVDALLTLQYTMEKAELDDIQKWCADVDDNGIVNATDALMILQCASGKRVLPERHWTPISQKTEIKNADITGVTKPVSGKTATVAGITTESEGVSIDSETYWSCDGSEFTGKYTAGKTYTLNIAATADSNYKFTENTLVTVNGKSAEFTLVSAEKIQIAVDYIAESDEDPEPSDPIPIKFDVPPSVLNNGAYQVDTSADNSFHITTDGLSEKTIYLCKPKVYYSPNMCIQKDMARFFYSLQGLVNRDFGLYHTSLIYEGTSKGEADLWLNEMMAEGQLFEGYNIVKLASFDDLMETFKAQIRYCGIVLWDPDVPATANAAGTICGLDGFLPVKYDTSVKTLYTQLMEYVEEYEFKIPVKMNLCGKFTGKGTIPDTTISSSGSAKNDVYLWALEKYMNRCSSKYIAYTVDGAVCVDSNYLSKLGDADTIVKVCLPNHDYLIAHRCFFFDLTPNATEAPCDDKTQPMGTDAATMKKILQKMYERNNGEIIQMMGFPPWWVKYTKHNNLGNIDDVVLEWFSVELFTAYNMAKEADAAQPSAMTNGSAYYKFVTQFKNFKNSTSSDSQGYNSNVHYFLFYVGDYDSSAWMKKYVEQFWSDPARGRLPLMWSFNPNLSNRIPNVWEYAYKNKTSNDYFAAGEGAGYIMPSALYQGFKNNYDGSVRTAPTASSQWIEYSKKLYNLFDMKITGFIINGVTPMNNTIADHYSNFNSVGAFCNSGGNKIVKRNGAYYLGIHNGVSAKTEDQPSSVSTMYNYMFSSMGSYNFCAYRTVSYSPTELETLKNAYISYAAQKGKTVKFVDPYAFFRLLAASGQGSSSY